MKSTTLVLLLVLVISTSCIPTGLNYARKNQLEKLKNKGTWASIMVNMAELHLQMGNPLNELIESIEAVSVDLDHKADKATIAFEKRTDFHKSEVARIQQLIDSANQDVVSTGEFIKNVLEIQVINLNNSIASLEKSISNNRQIISDETARREKNHESYLVVIKETDEAIQVVNEALEVLSELSGNEGNTNLLQVGTMKKHFKYMNSKKFLKSADAAFFVTLQSSVLDSEFADKGAIHKVEELITDVRKNLVLSKEKAEQQEEQQAADFIATVEKAKAEIVSMTNDITANNETLTNTENTIQDNLEFIEDRKRDAQEGEENLEMENNNYEAASNAYDELMVQIANEQQAVQAAMGYLKDASIEDYIGDRMESDVIIDQPHGQQLTVETSSPFE